MSHINDHARRVAYEAIASLLDDTGDRILNEILSELPEHPDSFWIARDAMNGALSHMIQVAQEMSEG